MSDLISRRALIEAFEPDHDCDWYTPDIIKKIEEQSTAEPVRGEWVHNDAGTWFCSVCDSEAYWDTDYGQQLFEFCPYCGADMRKKVE